MRRALIPNLKDLTINEDVALSGSEKEHIADHWNTHTDYINHIEHPLIKGLSFNCCKGKINRAEQDDDITYTVLALMMLEEHGLKLDTDL